DDVGLALGELDRCAPGPRLLGVRPPLSSGGHVLALVRADRAHLRQRPRALDAAGRALGHRTRERPVTGAHGMSPSMSTECQSAPTCSSSDPSTGIFSDWLETADSSASWALSKSPRSIVWSGVRRR